MATTKEIKSEYAIRLIQHTSNKSFQAFNEDLVLGDFIYSLETKTDKDYIEVDFVEGTFTTPGGINTILGISPAKAYMNIDHSQVDEGVFYLSSDNFRVTVDDYNPPNMYGNNTTVPNMWLNYIWRDADGTLHNVVGNDANTTHIQGERKINNAYTARYSVEAFGIGCVECDMKIRCTTKIFRSEAKARAYLNTGDDSGAIEPFEDEQPAVDRITTLFYASDIYSRGYNDSNLQRLGASTIYIDIQYATNEGEVIVDKHRAICGYVNTNNAINDSNHFGNIIWMAAPNVRILETKQSWLNDGHSLTQTLPNFANTTGFYAPLVSGTTVYECRYNSNMYIFANKTDAEKFLSGMDVKPIGGGGSVGPFNPDKLVGDPTVYNNPTATISSDMSSCWILNKSQVDELANIFATGLTSQESDDNDLIVNTLITAERSFLAHSEPIDAVVDLFWLPFDPREFSDNTTSHMTFVSDTYGIFEALGEAVDKAGRTVKGAYSNPMGRAWLPGGIAVQGIESMQELTGAVVSTIGSTSTNNKINVGTHHIE